MPKALVLDKEGDALTADVRNLSEGDLPEHDTLVAVRYSSLNYKDGLAVTGEGKIIRGEYPFVPGIDLVGEVEETSSDAFEKGDLVIGTGWGLGETMWGGFSEAQRVEAEWLVPLPSGLGARHAMTIGTAGLTAMLSVMALEKQGTELGAGEVVVTGASGGVGSIAVALLAARGYTVVASTGSEEAHDYLKDLGAQRFIGRDELGQGPQRPLDSARWSGAVDTVGGDTLAAVIATLERHTSVAACGNAGGFELSTTVFPFILRGANLLGIDSNTCPNERRRRAWQQLAELLTEDVLDTVTARVIGLEEVPAASRDILAGSIQGRVVVDVRR